MLRRSVCCQENKIKCQKAEYFRAFCEVCTITGALRKVWFSCMRTYHRIAGLTGIEMVKNAVGFRL